MRTLLAKEFQALVPIIVLVVVLALMDDVFILWSDFPDQKPLSTFFETDADEAELSLGTAIIALILALGLLVRESDEGTLSFLDGLPITRARVFAAKVIAALAVLTFSLILEFSTPAVFDVLSRNSLSAPFAWQVFGTGFALNWVVGFTSLGLLLPLSFLRRWLFLVIGVLAWAFVLFGQWRVPHLDLLNPLRLAQPAIQEGRWLVPGAHLAVQVALGLAGFCIALAAFSFTGDRTRRLADRLTQSRAGCALSIVAAIAIPAVWISFFVRLAWQMEAGKSRPLRRDVIEHHNTRHYAFLYRRGESDEALALAAEADAAHRRVTEFLGASALPQPITVDTTSQLARHNAGQAYWKKIRMQLAGTDAEEKDLAVLGHETAHVYLDQLSDGRLAIVFDSARWFHEGVASYVEHRFFRSPEALARFRRSAAAAHAWEPVNFEDFAKDAQWSRKRDRNLVYPLGELFCAALVETYGDTALGHVTRAFTRADAPKGLQGAALWRDTLQACGFSLDAVVASWRAHLDELVATEHAFIASLPRLSAKVSATRDEIVLTPAFDGKSPGVLVCHTRPRPDAAEYEHDHWPAGADGTIRVPRATLSGGTFWYQLGWRVPAAGLPISELWIEAPVP